MQIANTKFKRTIIVIISITVIAIVAVILFISPVAKYLVEKYDTKYTGRQIKMDWAYVNPFTGFVHIKNLRIFESDKSPALVNSDSIFFSAKSLSVNFTLFKLLTKTIELTEVSLNQPKGIIVQDNKNLNFNDLIETFLPDTTDTIPSKFHFSMRGIKIKNGAFYYSEKNIPIFYFIKNVNIESAGLYWNVDTVAVKFSFLPGIGTGSINGNITVNFKNLDYNLALAVEKLDLNIIDQYLKDLTYYGTFRAKLDANLKSSGNLKIVEKVTNKGLLVINDFHFGKDTTEDYISFKKLIMAIYEVSPGKHIYTYDSIMLIQPYFKYERYDTLDNLQTMFGKSGANISDAKTDRKRFNLILEIADYIKEMAKNFYTSNYKVDKLMINEGVIIYNDYSLTEKFSIEVSPFFIAADSINKTHKQVKIAFKSGIQPYGNIVVNLSINPQDSSDFDMHYRVQKLPTTLFNPYLITYTSYPLNRGTIELNGTWKVRNGIIKSDNRLTVIDPRIGKRLITNDKQWLPTPLVMFFIRERGNVIDYEIPITGNLKNPNFNWSDVVFDILENVFVKPPTTPYRMKVKNKEQEIEKSLTLKWKLRQNKLEPIQDKFVEKMIEFLKKTPEASIDVHPIQYNLKEKEYILFFEAKKKYFLLTQKGKSTDRFSENDSLEVNKMSAKDEKFVAYLNSHINVNLLFTIQEKCLTFIGPDIVNKKFAQLTKQREHAFIMQFKKNNLENRIKFHTPENSIPYNGFSYFKIEYNGDYPESLIKAYEKMNELNHEEPRNKFKERRRKLN